MPNAYYQGHSRPVIQVQVELGWVAWNWNTASWDFKDTKLDKWGEL